ncbi:hypothetical protein ACQKEF_09655 [Pseudomonas oryzihabitans]|uniref:hypothetical protein n=1 Tax=Pseudomonas oryzihabitans TaxID=47885 RepID=UPI003D00110F
MALQQVNFGSASDGSQGDTARAAFVKINVNFSDTTNAASRLVGTVGGNVMEVGAFGLGKPGDWRSTPFGKSAVTPNDVVSFGLRAGLAEGGPNGLAIPGLTGSSFGCLTYDVQWTDTSAISAITRRFVSGDRTFISSGVTSSTWTAWREVALSGDTPVFGAGLTLQRTTAGATQLNISSLAGNYKTLSFRSNDAARWNFGCNDAAEAGSNAGSNFFMFRMNDSGAYLGTPLQISRQTGLTTLESLSITGPVRPGQYTLASLPSASAFTGYEIDVTDAAGGAKRCRSDGTNWKILNTTTTVS